MSSVYSLVSADSLHKNRMFQCYVTGYQSSKFPPAARRHNELSQVTGATLTTDGAAPAPRAPAPHTHTTAVRVTDETHNAQAQPFLVSSRVFSDTGDTRDRSPYTARDRDTATTLHSR